MKNQNITKNRTGVHLLLVLAASIIGLAAACSTSARAGSPGYTMNDVSGIYVDLGSGYLYGAGGTNDKQSVAYSFAGLVTFTPSAGTFHAEWVVREYGESDKLVDDAP